MVVLLSLPVSLLVSVLRLDITTRMALLASPEISDQSSNLIFGSLNSERHFMIRLLSRSRNLTISEQNGNLFADSLLIASLDNSIVNTLSIKCFNDISLEITLNNNTSKMMLSPSLCRENSQLKLQIGGTNGSQERFFDGCIGNITIDTKILLDRWCRDANEQSDGPRPPPLYVEPSHFTEPLVLNEGAMVSIQSWNIQGFSKRYHENYPKEDILFRILEPPQHGQLLKHGQSVSQFVSSDILSNKIYYKHDDSETTVDFIRLEGEIISQKGMARKRNMIYNIAVRINPVNDAPELRPGTDSERLWITGDSKYDSKKKRRGAFIY
ncbi:hypothetical protein X798_06096 [Onchocerca flexuosa]|uniref:Uncharacterized protein n=1 Tax=Onchocerca flexuosa TaxID=387005 RepID=A0A238BNE8_9BILA|nr:hypothetical protein X798_06096 [Onchocerca flexuosa]